MKTLGILIDKAGYSQKFKHIAEELNKLDSSINAVVFYNESAPIPLQTKFTMMHSLHALNFDGVLMSTDIYTSSIMLNSLRPSKRFFYVWDLEYMYRPFSFGELQSVYNNKKIELIARNEYRARLLARTWKAPHSIMEEFNYERLQKLL